jgi:C_GCAxxG_C_C family probable redox protein
MTKEKKASDTFAQGYSCSQAVLSARCEKYGLDQKTALTIAAGFGGGMGRTGGACGAVTGAISIIGLHAGSDQAGDSEAKENTYRIVREFVAEFEEEFGSVNCKELLGCDIGSPAGYDQARKQGMFENICPRFVDGALEIFDRVMEHDRKQSTTPDQTDSPTTQ